MELSDNFKPRLSDPSLLFTSEDFVVIEDLKRGLRRLLSRWHHPSAALMMVEALNFQYLRSRNRSSRVILPMADSQMAECIIVDIYARVLQCKSRVTTARAKGLGISIRSQLGKRQQRSSEIEKGRIGASDFAANSNAPGLAT